MAAAVLPRDAGLQVGWRYGLLGLPLAFCALPLYVLMPNLYATQWGVSLGALGTVLMALRILDAVADPLIGRWCDHLAAGAGSRMLAVMGGACGVLATAFTALFHPAVEKAHALQWASLCLAILYLSYSLLTVAHQSWGARLGGDAVQRSRVVAWREGLGLVGVVLASVVPAVWGVSAMSASLVVALALGIWALTHAPRPLPGQSIARSRSAADAPWYGPWRNTVFVRLLLVLGLNGMATAVPATLVLFFIQDQLQLPSSWQAVFLGLYFLCGALSMPLWLRCVARLGLARSWLAGMGLSVAAFGAAALAGTGDAVLFGAVCLVSGLALGSDLALPAALLAGITAREGQSHGVYFGWWNFVNKLSLALAAGCSLPALAWLGYAPGARDLPSLQALTAVYCLLPCVLKLLAAGALYLFFIHKPSGRIYAT